MSTQTNTILEKASHYLTKEIAKQITSLAKIERVRYETYLKIKDFVLSNLEVKDKVTVVVSSPIVLQDIIVEGIGYYRLFLFNALDNSLTAYVGDFTERYEEEYGSLKEVPVATPTQSKDPRDHTPVEEWIHVLLDSYRKLILLEYNEPKPSHFNYAKLTKDHLFWMCDELVKYTDTGKRHRWLGYIQGVLAMDGCLSVQREMDVTRELIAPNRLSNSKEALKDINERLVTYEKLTKSEKLLKTHLVNKLTNKGIDSLIEKSRVRGLRVELVHPDRVVDLTLHPNGDLTQTDYDVLRGYIEENLVAVTFPGVSEVTFTTVVSSHCLNIRLCNSKQIVGSVKLGLNVRSEPTIFIKYKV